MDTKEELKRMCESIADELENEETDIQEWLDQQLSVEKVCFSPSYGDVVDFEVLCSFGGPNIFVDKDFVRGYWGADRVTIGYSDDRLLEEIEERYSGGFQ